MEHQFCGSPVLRGTKKWVAVIKRNFFKVYDADLVIKLTPQQCIDVLVQFNLLSFYQVRKNIGMSSDTWKANFLKLRGLGILLSALETLGSGKVKSILDTHASMECVSSIMSLVNSHVGLDYVLASHSILNGLAEG